MSDTNRHFNIIYSNKIISPNVLFSPGFCIFIYFISDIFRPSDTSLYYHIKYFALIYSSLSLKKINALLYKTADHKLPITCMHKSIYTSHLKSQQYHGEFNQMKLHCITDPVAMWMAYQIVMRILQLVQVKHLSIIIIISMLFIPIWMKSSVWLSFLQLTCYVCWLQAINLWHDVIRYQHYSAITSWSRW